MSDEHIRVPGYVGQWPYEVFFRQDEPGKLDRHTFGVGFAADTHPPEVRYDLEEGTGPSHGRGSYRGLTPAEAMALCKARCDLIDLRDKWMTRA